MIFTGRWSGLAPDLIVKFAQSCIREKFEAFAVRLAHPLSNTENIAELNPHLFSSLSPNICRRIVTPSTVGLGEMDPDGEIHYGYSHNQRILVFCQITTSPPRLRSMFDKPGQLTFHHYKPFANDTASDVPSEEYIAIARQAREAARGRT